MIDGFKGSTMIQDLPTWQDETGIDLLRAVNDRTGELSEIRNRYKFECDNDTDYKSITCARWGKFESYRIKVLETRFKDGSITWRLQIRGSLHKNAMKENASRFTWELLQNEINHIESILLIPANQLKIDNLEFGVNIPWSCPVYSYLKRSLIGYMRCQFDPYSLDGQGRRLGFFFDGSQYLFKVYDKSMIYDLKTDFMRIEKSVKKMQALNGIGIKTLQDLKDYKKVDLLLPNLMDSWKKVTIIDPGIYSKLKGKDIEKMQLYSNPKFWSNLVNESERKFKYHMSILKDIQSYNCDLIHSGIANQMNDEWRLCRDNIPNKIDINYPTKFGVPTIQNYFKNLRKIVPNLPSVNNDELYPFYPLNKM